MSDEIMPEHLRVDPTDPLAEVSFSGPAVLADRFLVTEKLGIVRIALSETSLDGSVHFRGAAVLSLRMAEELSEILAVIVKNAKARDATE